METQIKREKSKSFWLGALVGGIIFGVIITAVACVALIAQAGFYAKGIGSAHLQAIESSIPGGSSSSEIIDADVIDKVSELENIIDKYFLFEEDVDIEAMRTEIYSAILDSLGDKYTVYYTEEELAQLLSESEGVYYGIGSYVQIDEESSLPMLTQIFPGSPAEQAGLRSGDKVYAADGTVLKGLTLSDAVAIIKGPQYTDVVLTIIRDTETFDVKVTRDKCEAPTVITRMEDNNVGYLQITEFDDITYTQFVDGYNDLLNQGMKSLIIDLRNNPGGNLNTVVDICGEILPKGVITYTVDKNGKRNDYNGKGKNVIDIPLVVLVNGNSASASELMTGAIRDYEKGTIIGTTTFGKGIVQRILPLKDGSGLKITTSRYYTPNGECIHGVGITPDIEIEFDSELYYGEQGIDNQLQKAIDYLSSEMGKQ